MNFLCIFIFFSDTSSFLRIVLSGSIANGFSIFIWLILSLVTGIRKIFWAFFYISLLIEFVSLSKQVCTISFLYITLLKFIFIFHWVFFHKHSRLTWQQEKEEAFPLTPLYHFHTIHRHLDISRNNTAVNSTMYIASSQALNGNLWFPSTIH